MIKVNNVSKIYTLGEEIITALDNVNLEIKEGESVAIIGPSGSGKSTLMHIIGGLDSPDSGTISVDELDLTKEKDDDQKMAEYRNKRIGFVFQTFNLEQTLTALENVEMPLIFGNVDEKEARAMARLALKKVGLGDRTGHKPNELSGGQRQRVSIARAIVNEPDILLADEPTGNLDSKTGSMIMKLLRDLNRKEKLTLIVVTHDEEIAKKAGKIIKIRDGKLIKD